MVKTIQKYCRRQNGSALLIVLMIFLIVGVMISALMSVAMTNSKIGQSDRDFQAAYYIASSGLNYEIENIKSEIIDIYNRDDVTDAKTFSEQVQAFVDGYSEDLTVDDGTFSNHFGHVEPRAEVDISSTDPWNYNLNPTESHTYEVISEGDYNNKQRILAANIIVTWVEKATVQTAPDIRFAVFSNSKIKMNSNTKISGGLGINSISSNAVEIENKNVQIDGGVAIAPGGDADVIFKLPNKTSIDDIVSGEVSEMLETITYPLPIFPKPNESDSIFYNLVDKGTIELNSNQSSGITQDGYYNQISLNSNSKLTINTGSDVRIIRVRSLSVNSNAEIELIGDGILHLYVDQTLSVNSNAVLNQSGSSEKLFIYFAGNSISFDSSEAIKANIYIEDASSINMNSNTEIDGVIVVGGTGAINLNSNNVLNGIYAPNRTINMNSNVEINGFLVCDTVTMNSNSLVKYAELERLNELIGLLGQFDFEGTGGGSTTGTASGEPDIIVDLAKER